MGSGGEPGMNLSDLQGPQRPPAAAAVLRGRMSRPGRRLRGPAKDMEGILGTPLPCDLHRVPSFDPLISLLQIQLPPRFLAATSFPRPGAVAEESLGCHRTGVSELNIWKKERDTASGWGIQIWDLENLWVWVSAVHYLGHFTLYKMKMSVSPSEAVVKALSSHWGLKW